MLGSLQGRHDLQAGGVRMVVGTQGSTVSMLQGELGFDDGPFLFWVNNPQLKIHLFPHHPLPPPSLTSLEEQ